MSDEDETYDDEDFEEEEEDMEENYEDDFHMTTLMKEKRK